jgi:hypothetical protein
VQKTIGARATLMTAVILSTMLVACTAPAQPFVPSNAGVIVSRHSTPTDTTFLLEDEQQLTFGAGVRWLNGMPGEGDLLLAGTTPTRGRRRRSGTSRGRVA